MKVLLVEDDENKRLRVEKYYLGAFPEDEVFCADSMVAGLRSAKEYRPDLIILDMTLPNYSISSAQGFNPMRPFGGRDFLQQLSRLKLGAQVVVLTQFETFGSPPDLVDLQSLDAELRGDFSNIYLGAIYYHASKSSWQNEINSIRNSLDSSVS